MRVITQLIRHFWQRGALTPLEIEYLLQHGFAQMSDLPGYIPRKSQQYHATDDLGPAEPEPLDSLEWREQELVRRLPRRGRGGVESPKGELDINDLRERLQGEFERRQVDLASVLALGRRFADAPDWPSAAAELRSVTANRFHRGICAELRSGDVLLGDIWQASDPEPFHSLISYKECRGRAARSFLALLVATGPDALGKYSWILKYDEMQAVINLRVLHNRVLESLSRIYHRDRLLLTRAMAKNSDPVQIWSLVILYNAHRNSRQGFQPQYGKEYGPVDIPDDIEMWKRAWTSAVRMDRTQVSDFLVACYDQNADGQVSLQSSDEFGDQLQRPLMCPVGWHLP